MSLVSSGQLPLPALFNCAQMDCATQDSKDTSAKTTTGNDTPLQPKGKTPYYGCSGQRASVAEAWAVSTGITCIVCKESQRDWRSLWGHMMSHNPTPKDPELLKDCRLPNGLLQCLVCGHQSQGTRDLRRHYYRHSADRPFECNLCRKRYKAADALLTHLTRTHGRENTVYKCDQCDYSTDRKHLARIHGTSVHSDKERCEVCFKRVRKDYIKEHYFLHTGETRFSCELCGRRFVYNRALRRHVEIVHLRRGHACKVCGKIVKYSHSLVRHMKRFHASQPTDICCVCSKPFYYNGDYVKHVARVHIREKREKCIVCGRGFYNRAELQRHVTVHTRDSLFLCDVCGKAFALKERIRDHMVSHSDERPFKCSLCGLTYKRRQHLTQHARAKHA